MHVQSQARARAGSAPAQLTTRPSQPTPDRLAAATARWQAALVDTEGRLEAGLRQQLLHHAVSGGERLDLSGHGEALKAAPSAVLDEVMAAMADLCAARGEPPTTLVLPPGLRKPPAWLHHFSATQALEMAHFKGRHLDARCLPALQRLGLGDMAPRELGLRLPAGCQLQMTHPDGRPARLTTTLRPDHQRIRLQWRPLNFNGVIDRNTDKEKYVCRHLSIEKIRQWGRAMFVEAGPDPMASAAGIEREITPDTEALFEALVHGPRSAHLVAHAHWPDFVRHQFEQMQREGRRVAIALMTTGSHAMALRFDATNPDQPRVECWDPNFTDITTTSDPPFDFRSMFHDFARVRDIYFGSDHSLHGPASFVKVTMIDHPLDPGLDVADRPRDSATSIAFAGLPETCHPTLVHDLIAFGHNPPDLAPLAAAIDNQPLTREQCLGLLRALDPLARPSLHIAASRGHDRAIAAMVPLLLAACHKGLLNETDVRTVMEARVLKGTALGSAFTEGHAHVVTALGRAAQQLWREGALSPRTVFHLMRAANPSGASTIERIKDTRTAKALDASLKKLYRAGALTKEDYQELHKDAKETLEDLRAQAKARQRSARTEPVAPTLLRV